MYADSLLIDMSACNILKRFNLSEEGNIRRSEVLEKSLHQEELKKIRILAKQKTAEENFRELQVCSEAVFVFYRICDLFWSYQERREQDQMIKFELERLKQKVNVNYWKRATIWYWDVGLTNISQERLENVERIRRKEEFAKTTQRQRLDAVDKKIEGIEQSKNRAHEEKMRVMQEMRLQDEVCFMDFSVCACIRFVFLLSFKCTVRIFYLEIPALTFFPPFSAFAKCNWFPPQNKKMEPARWFKFWNQHRIHQGTGMLLAQPFKYPSMDDDPHKFLAPYLADVYLAHLIVNFRAHCVMLTWRSWPTLSRHGKNTEAS